MTYVEKELRTLGFKLVESGQKRVVLSISHLKLQFDCACLSYPDIKALGCPLHHTDPGGSWPVEEAKRIASLMVRGVISDELEKHRKRNKELVVDLMCKSAELSDASDIVKRWRTELEIVASKTGHNLCWIWIPLLLKQTLGHTGNWPDPEQVSEEEFKAGCDDFRDCVFHKRTMSLIPPK